MAYMRRFSRRTTRRPVRRIVKRRTTSRFKRRRNGPKQTSYSTRSERGNAFRLGGQKLRSSTWRNRLWNQTLSMAKYRSINSLRTTITTPATGTTSTIAVFQMLRFGGNNFYDVAGGALPPDPFAAVLPFVADSMVIRGGAITFSLSNAGADTVGIDAFIMWATSRPDFTLVPASASIGWDPTLTRQMQDIGRVVLRKNILLKSQDTVTVSMKLRVQKIENDIYDNRGGAQPYLFLIARNVIGVVPQTITVQLSYNLTFVGDSV